MSELPFDGHGHDFSQPECRELLEMHELWRRVERGPVIASESVQPASLAVTRRVERQRFSSPAMNSRVPAGPESSREIAPAVWLDGDHKLQETAAAALGIHHSRDRRKRIVLGSKPDPKPLIDELVVLGTLKQVGEESIPPSPERIRG